MKKMKVAINPDLLRYIRTERPTVALDEADLTEVSAVVFNDADALTWIRRVQETGFGIPTFVVNSSNREAIPSLTVPDIRVASTIADIPLVVSFTTSSEKTFFVQTCAIPMCPWATCSFMKVHRARLRKRQPEHITQIKHILF